jgi:hypothetical protein
MIFWTVAVVNIISTVRSNALDRWRGCREQRVLPNQTTQIQQREESEMSSTAVSGHTFGKRQVIVG